VPTTSESGRRYAPSGTASALVLEFRSQTNAAHKLTIEIPNLHFLSVQERSMDGVVYDTLMVMPVYSASDKTNLRKVELVNAQSVIIPADASIQQVGTGITGVYSPY
jgi:predicted nucleic acid-binding protein